MTKANLIGVVAQKSGLPKAAVEKAINAIFDSIMGTLKKGDKVTLVGFGTFDVVKRAAREGINPRTGATIKIKARKAPRFKAGKALKDSVAK
ncbi:MAG: DNA-binding protein HU [Deltaproteobacteria bacterium ADurb.Bin135]|nr:MAG: DNA-binding protein HU [Deltaproteobacteria bacterium ADurb.Bin135]